MAVSRRALIAGAAGAVGAAALAGGLWWRNRERPPNIVLILTDDQGFSDLSCTWQPTPDDAFPRIDTPRLDSLAADGIRLDTFYVGASVCTPSRASLLTGCYPPRVGFGHKDRGIGVLGPKSLGGLNPDERTLAEVLKSAGYRTGLVGKWHLGHHPVHHPNNHGFDQFFGIPYSNNQQPLPLFHDRQMVQRLPKRPVLEGMFTQAAVGFIEQHARSPFFLYLAHSAPHWPWNVAPEHRLGGPRGIYGDVIARIDWSVGEVLDTLDRYGIAEDTIVLFLSDNGPYVEARTGLGGTNYPFRGHKTESFEGGVRSPCLIRWPGVIPAGHRSDELTSALDLFPTLAAVAGATHDPVDGRDIGPILRGEPDARSPHEVFLYYARGRLEAIRDHRYKRFYENGYRDPIIDEALYDLVDDPGETTDVSSDHPDVVAKLDQAADLWRQELGDVMRGIEGSGVRPLAMATGG